LAKSAFGLEFQTGPPREAFSFFLFFVFFEAQLIPGDLSTPERFSTLLHVPPTPRRLRPSMLRRPDGNGTGFQFGAMPNDNERRSNSTVTDSLLWQCGNRKIWGPTKTMWVAEEIGKILSGNRSGIDMAH